MRSIKVILGGIVLILSSIFFMNVYFISEGLVLGLFIAGIIICVIGLFFVKDYDVDDDDEEYDTNEDFDDFEEQSPQ